MWFAVTFVIWFAGWLLCLVACQAWGGDWPRVGAAAILAFWPVVIPALLVYVVADDIRKHGWGDPL